MGHHLGSIFTGTDRNGQAYVLHQTILCRWCVAELAGFMIIYFDIYRTLHLYINFVGFVSMRVRHPLSMSHIPLPALAMVLIFSVSGLVDWHELCHHDMVCLHSHLWVGGISTEK